MSNNLRQARLDKLQKLKEANIQPYPYSFPRTHTLSDLIHHFHDLQKTQQVVATIGRVMLWRPQGGTTFGTLLDHSWKRNGKEARFQIYLNKEVLGEEKYLLFRKNVDIGDWIGLKGTLFASKTGELTLQVQEITILCKGIQNLPDKHAGMKDEEQQQRHRELQFITDSEARRRFLLRSKIFQGVREIMWSKGFHEVDVPTLQTVYGGGEATPFRTHVNALDIDVYLSIAPELFLKRYLVGMFDRVFHIGKNFRNEGIDRTHHPEFSCFEGYAALMDYEDVMNLVESLIEELCIRVHGSPRFVYDGKSFDVSTPWKRHRMIPSLTQKLGRNPMEMSKDELLQLMNEKQIHIDPKLAKGYLIVELFEILFKEDLLEPCFVVDFPEETSPLCKKHRSIEGLIERFEGYINGWEICNAYSELNDPIHQRELLARQVRMLGEGLEQGSPMDEDFAFALDVGMPPTGGFGIGLDRISMLFTDARSIQDVIAFPLMRPKVKIQTGLGTESEETLENALESALKALKIETYQELSPAQDKELLNGALTVLKKKKGKCPEELQKIMGEGESLALQQALEKILQRLKSEF